MDRTIQALNERGKSIKGAKLLILGFAYKKDIDDSRESPSLKLIALFREKGAKVSYNDPYIPASSGHREYPGVEFRSVSLTAKRLKDADAVIIATDHSVYDFDWIVRNSKLIVDTRHAVRRRSRKVVKA
jgi:UDP-N-acetyl-D-glucosamine dehydrogenase